jgi:hypothetical protein
MGRLSAQGNWSATVLRIPTVVSAKGVAIIPALLIDPRNTDSLNKEDLAAAITAESDSDSFREVLFWHVDQVIRFC